MLFAPNQCRARDLTRIFHRILMKRSKFARQGSASMALAGVDKISKCAFIKSSKAKPIRQIGGKYSKCDDEQADVLVA